MPLVVPDVGELYMLDRIRAALNAPVITFLRLYQNNYTPVQGSVLADFTEATFSGYAQLAVTDFGAAATVSNKAKIICAAAKVFSHSGGATSNTIYGYHVVYLGAPTILYAERFASPIVMAVSGDVISITPALTLNSEN
jgi:hypothetical protein